MYFFRNTVTLNFIQLQLTKGEWQLANMVAVCSKGIGSAKSHGSKMLERRQMVARGDLIAVWIRIFTSLIGGTKVSVSIHRPIYSSLSLSHTLSYTDLWWWPPRVDHWAYFCYESVLTYRLWILLTSVSPSPLSSSLHIVRFTYV